MSKQYLTVSALTKYIKRKFDADPYLERVFLTGEISNFRKRPNHQYFSVKDDHALIQAVMYRHEFNRLKFDLKDGMKVLLIGRVNLYEPSGNYNIIIEHMEPDGVGALYLAYEELKKKLAQEGLFSLPKKTLPLYPKKIAVVTSPSGAVIRDIITTIERRYPIAQIVLYPTVVQGKGSAASIVSNLQKINQSDEYDLAIIGRGGGSIEDLWSFNEEAVIRQIVAMTIPIISSVGHETDTTLSDLAADIRAATPTAAAEISVPVLSEVIQGIKNQEQRLYQSTKSKMVLQQEKLTHFMQSYVFRQPKRLYEGHLIRLDQQTTQLQTMITQRTRFEKREQEQLYSRMIQANPLKKIDRLTYDWQQLDKSLENNMKQLMIGKRQTFTHAVESLDLLSPLKVMTRGYAYVSTDQKIIKSINDVAVGESVNIHLKDGNVTAEVKEVEENNHDKG